MTGQGQEVLGHSRPFRHRHSSMAVLVRYWVPCWTPQTTKATGADTERKKPVTGKSPNDRTIQDCARLSTVLAIEPPGTMPPLFGSGDVAGCQMLPEGRSHRPATAAVGCAYVRDEATAPTGDRSDRIQVRYGPMRTACSVDGAANPLPKN